MKKYFICCLFGAMGFLLSSCGKDNKGFPVAQSTSNQSPSNSGGSVTGGSNSINGKPVESYIQSIYELPEYKSILKPLLKRIGFLSPELALKLNNSLKYTRTWYFVPGKLQEISNYEIAVPLNEQTDQFAIHHAKAIWISSDERNTLLNSDDIETGLKNSARHLLHEMVMSLRVDQNLLNHKNFLTLEDYDDIRAVTDYLFNKSYSSFELNYFLALHNFGKKIDPSLMYDILNIPKDLIIKNVNLATSDNLFQYLSTRTTAQLPSIFYGRTERALGQCHYSFNPLTETIKVSTDYRSQKDQEPLSMEIKVVGAVRTLKLSDNKMYIVGTEANWYGKEIYKNITVLIQDNEIKKVSFYFKSRSPFWKWGSGKVDVNWDYRDQQINCLQNVDYLKEKTILDKIFIKLGII